MAGEESKAVPRIHRTTVLLTVAAALSGAVAYRCWVRPRVLHWGATAAEANAEFPGDEFMPHADGVSTRAISIAAAPANVYPWLVQIGPSPRGGAYTYDWIENLLGLDFHSTDAILPEYQHPIPGEEIAFGPRTMAIVRADANQTFVVAASDGNWVWSFNLVPEPGGTRLVSRNRYRFASLADIPMMEFMIPGSLVMERRMLHGIRDRAECTLPEDLLDRRAPDKAVTPPSDVINGRIP